MLIRDITYLTNYIFDLSLSTFLFRHFSFRHFSFRHYYGQPARYQHTASVLPNGKVLVTGGQGSGTSTQLYDPSTGVWSASGSMSVARNLHTASILLNGKVLVTGGQGSGTSAQLYQP